MRLEGCIGFSVAAPEPPGPKVGAESIQAAHVSEEEMHISGESQISLPAQECTEDRVRCHAGHRVRTGGTRHALDCTERGKPGGGTIDGEGKLGHSGHTNPA